MEPGRGNGAYGSHGHGPWPSAPSGPIGQPEPHWQPQHYNELSTHPQNRHGGQTARPTQPVSGPSRRGPSSTRTMAQVTAPDSLDEVFRLVKIGVEAEKGGHYKGAMKSYLSAGEMLMRIEGNEPNLTIRDQLEPKALEILDWCDQLADWYENGMLGPCPPKKGRTVAAFVADHLGPDLCSPVAPSASEEFTCMTYTAVTTQRPKDFTSDGYALRCLQYGRRPKLMVVITMYNEDEKELEMTLRKVANNIHFIRNKKLPGFEGDRAWQQILVVIVSDGRVQANPGTLSFLRNIGLFDEDVMLITSSGLDVQLHMFQYSPTLIKHRLVRSGGKVQLLRKDGDSPHPPMQIVFALKEHNAGKLNSHQWFFDAFAEQVSPEFTILLDVGTLPTKSAIYKLLAAMEVDDNIGGCCGEIAVDTPLPLLCNWVVAAQHFEYKVSNILDKATESVFGYISVLPGAFSAYRYSAIQGPPLEAYFKQLSTPQKELGPFNGNMYLAEDRILCFEIVAREKCEWKLQYIKNAIARTDTPRSLVDLLGQRRRWLNGSFFALLYTVKNWGRIRNQSRHSCLRQMGFMFQYCSMLLQVFISWTLVANFYLVIYALLIDGIRANRWGFMDTSGAPDWVLDLIEWVYELLWALFIGLQFVVALGNKRQHVADYYFASAIFFAIFSMLAFLVALIQASYRTLDLFSIIVALLVIGVFFIAGAIHGEIHHIVLSCVQYFALLPTMSIVFSVYSFCNLHDLSWGTKGLDSANHGTSPQDSGSQSYEDIKAKAKAEEERKKLLAKEEDDLKKEFGRFRTSMLIKWVASNLLYVVLICSYLPFPTYLNIIIGISGVYNLWRLIFSTLFIAKHATKSMTICCTLNYDLPDGLRERPQGRDDPSSIQYAEHQTPHYPPQRNAQMANVV